MSSRLGTVCPPPTGPDASQGTTATIMKVSSGSDSDCVHFTRSLEGGVQSLHVQRGPAEEDRNWHASFRPSPLANRVPGGQSPVPARIRGSECGRVQAPCSLPSATAFQVFAKHSSEGDSLSPRGGCSHRAQAAEEGARACGYCSSSGSMVWLPRGPCPAPTPRRGCPWAYYRPVQLLKIVPVWSQNQ